MQQVLSDQFSQTNVYLNSATMGLPCKATVKTMQDDLESWQDGSLNPVKYDEMITRCREIFARLAGVAVEQVVVGNQVSPLVGMLAASLKKGTQVLAVEGDFTSLIFPFMIQKTQGVTTKLVELADLAENINKDTDWVVVSVVQSSNGKLADLATISQKAKACGARVLVDTTQSAGWLEVNPEYWDMLVCGAYKWLLSPRGTTFAAIKPEVIEMIVPINANWYAGKSIWDSVYGSPLRLANSARRFDLSPAWLCWGGTLPALELIQSIGVKQIHQHNINLANRFRSGLGLEPDDSAIVCIDDKQADNKLKRKGIVSSIRAGLVRLSFHLYNDEADVDAVLEALTT